MPIIPQLKKIKRKKCLGLDKKLYGHSTYNEYILIVFNIQVHSFTFLHLLPSTGNTRICVTWPSSIAQDESLFSIYFFRRAMPLSIAMFTLAGPLWVARERFSREEGLAEIIFQLNHFMHAECGFHVKVWEKEAFQSTFLVF